MTHSPFPRNLHTCSDSPLKFLLLQTHFPITTLKFRTHSSHQNLHFQPPKPSQTKNKKRKPKPSFHDQIRHKWSSKIDSPRQNLPWQEQTQLQNHDFEPKLVDTHQISEVSDEKLSFGLGNRVVLAPWVHGDVPRNTHLDFVDEIGENCNGVRGFSQNLELFNGEVTIDGDVDRVRVYRRKSKGFDGGVVYGGKLKEERRISRDMGSTEVSQISFGNVDRNGGFGLFSKSNGAIDSIRTLENDCEIGESTKKFDREVSYDSKFEKANRIDAKEKIVDHYVSSNDTSDSMRLPWERKRGLEYMEQDKSSGSNSQLAEKLLPAPELQRLRNAALRMRERITVGVAGVTQALVDSIHEKWKIDEVVKLKFEGSSSLNMRRTHELLESKTGGLVIWRSGTSLVLYRGMSYNLRCVQTYAKHNEPNLSVPQYSKYMSSDISQSVRMNDSIITRSYSESPSEELVDLSELNSLLDDLGPRFHDWSGRDPLPVDADLLPPMVRGYKPPFRLLPYGTRNCLRNKEMTNFRRLARTMPPHFALGRNRELQGLAAAMVKLWERSTLAKIAIKRGVMNTCNERMAQEIKNLTGGTLLSRNKEYIVFYRGNDFLPPTVTEALVERRKQTELQQDEEEQAREKALALIDPNAKVAKVPLVAGTLAETMAATSRWGSQPSKREIEKMMNDSALARRASLVRHLEKQLSLAKQKIGKAEKALRKVQEFLNPNDLPSDLETLSDEERFLFRKMGLSMKPFLVLGRRGIFDGTIENMHLHWKYRELVKIIVGEKSFAQVKHIAISLEAESNGVLVSLDKTTKGYAIIVYRGKNYQQPRTLRPKNLLTRKQALARSIELQRREALKHHISDLQERIELVKSELEEMKMLKGIDDETLNSKMGDAYFSDEDTEEDEDEEAYLEVYDGGEDDDSNI